MSTKYDAFKDAFEMKLNHEIQQESSVLMKCVTKGSIEGEFLNVDYLDAEEASEIVGRNQDTIADEADFQRRRVAIRRFAKANFVDKLDVARIMMDPTGDIMANSKMAIERQIDQLIYAAFDATVTGGRSGGDSFAFDTNNVISATSGLTFEKLLDTKTLLDVNSLGSWANDDHYLIVSPYQIGDLLAETEVGSADYNTVRTLTQGKVDSFMGFNIISAPINLVSKTAAIRKCFAFSKRGMFWGINDGITARVDERPDKNYSVQVYVDFMGNALRKYEELVIRVDATES